LGNAAWADDASKAEAVRLLDSMGMGTTLETVIDTAIDGQIEAHPEMKPFRPVIRQFFMKYMSYEALKPELAEIYGGEFTAQELAEARAFYSTPTGKKFISKLPLLLNKGSQLGQQIVQAHLPELQDAIKAEAERLKQVGSAG
jgi:hypothetical protein